jgi:hypothetical protein
MQLRLVAVSSLGAMQLGCNGETIEAPEPGATIHIEAASPTTLTGTIGDIRRTYAIALWTGAVEKAGVGGPSPDRLMSRAQRFRRLVAQVTTHQCCDIITAARL